MTENRIEMARDGAIVTVTLNRPEKLNAVDPAMLRGLESVITSVEPDPDIRAIIISGAGKKAFCAGADIKAWAKMEPLDMWREWIPAGHRVLSRLSRLPIPVIAAINGAALGGGLELALACDIRVAANTASFGLPEVSIGTVPGWGGTSRLPEVVGTARAKALILTAERIDASTAFQWGLVTEVVPPGKLMTRAHTLATKIAASAPLAIRMAKQLVDGQHGREHMEALAGALCAFTDDGREGVNSFTEKRSPRYSGK